MKKKKRYLAVLVAGVLLATAVLSGCGQSKKEISKNDDHLTVYLWENRLMENIATQRTPEFPGNRPYRQYGGVPFKPTVNKKCTSCGLCAKECPTGAISLDDPKITDNDKCISCMHCVAVCPKKARNYSKFISFIAGRNMKKICSGRKENKLYL